MSKATSYLIAPNLYLVDQHVSQGTTKPAEPQPTNHVMVIDCSGSMSGDLPKIREQLKRRLPKLLKDGDTFSLIWFSGRGEFGTLIEAEPVATLKDLQDINKQIDRWLRPIGLTGFKEPLAEVSALAKRVMKKNGNPFSLFFMSDGCDNQWSRNQVLDAIESVDAFISAATFVEYGYYADRPLLTAMAERVGGTLIFAEDFNTYEPIVEAKLQQRAIGGDWVSVKIGGDMIGGIAYALDHEKFEITAYTPSKGQVSVPSTVDRLFYLSAVPVDRQAATSLGSLAADGRVKAKSDVASRIVSAAYAAMSLFAIRMKPDLVYPILKALGDVAFIDAFAGCFGKQKYTEFMQTARTAAFDPAVRMLFGYDPDKVPADDAFTVLDLLRILTEDGETRLLLDHPSFEYSKISRGRVNADENFYVAEQETLAELRAKLAAAKKPAEVKAVQAEIDALVEHKRDALQFVPDAAPDGYPLEGLTYNENRANISLRVKKTGTVNLAGRIAEFKHGTSDIPVVFQTHIWRNYAIVVDGLVNFATLPAIVSKTTTAKLRTAGVKFRMLGDSTLPTDTILIDVKALPVINRKMVKGCSAKGLFELQYRLTRARAFQKVYNDALKQVQPPTLKSPGLLERYGAEAVEWLKEQGITDNGFSPKTTVIESKDFYIGKELEVKLKGLSTLPKVADAKAGKGGVPGEFMREAIHEIEANKRATAANPEEHYRFVEARQKEVVAETRKLIAQMAQQKFAIIVGQVWPREFSTIEENTLQVDIDGKTITGQLVMSEIQVRI